MTARSLIADAIDIIVVLDVHKGKKSSEVRRVVKELVEVNGLTCDGSYNLKYILQDK